MKKFIVFGKEESIFTENEVNSITEFGMDAEVEFWHPYLGFKKIRYHNLTEVHYLYNRDMILYMREWNNRPRTIPQECFHTMNADLSYSPRCAFESDLHGRGGTRAIGIMTSIVVTSSDKMYPEYMEVLEEVSEEEATKAWRNSRALDDRCLYA